MGRKRFDWLPGLALVVAATAAGIGLSRAAGSSGTSPPDRPQDPCSAVVDPLPGAVDPLPEVGLPEIQVPAALVEAFPRVGVVCTSAEPGDEAFVQAVYVTFSDDDGKAAVYIALHPKQRGSMDLWRQDLQAHYPEAELEFHDVGEGASFALARGHPRSAEALAAFRDAGETMPLWTVMEHVVRALGPQTL